jgi:hypothetical protein
MRRIGRNHQLSGLRELSVLGCQLSVRNSETEDWQLKTDDYPRLKTDD